MQKEDRKKKSLGVLCRKFIDFYPRNKNPNDPNILISLDEIAVRLDVERRRVYDIVNVLESIEMLTKSSKNKYIWHGFNSLNSTLSKLKTLSVKSDFFEYTKSLMRAQYSNESNSSNIVDSNNIKKEKSLGIMSQKFLMLFLMAENQTISITFAARVLLGDTRNEVTECGRFKTKIRRLYDIANVLSTVGLIQKCSDKTIDSLNKSAYKYIGPIVEINRNAEFVESFINKKTTHLNGKHSFFDHFQKTLTNSSQIPKFNLNTGVLQVVNKNDQVKEIKIEELEQELLNNNNNNSLSVLSNIQNFSEQPIANNHHQHFYQYQNCYNQYYDSCYLNQQTSTDEPYNNNINSYQTYSSQQYSNVQTNQNYYDQSLTGVHDYMFSNQQQQQQQPQSSSSYVTFKQETTLKQYTCHNEYGQLIESTSLLENKKRKFTQYNESTCFDNNNNYQHVFQTMMTYSPSSSPSLKLPITSNNFNYDSNFIFQ